MKRTEFFAACVAAIALIAATHSSSLGNSFHFDDAHVIENNVYLRSLEHDPRSADAWNNLGWSLAQLGFRAEAVRAYREFLALRPGDARTANNLRLLEPPSR